MGGRKPSTRSKKQPAKSRKRPVLTLFKWCMIFGIWLFIGMLGVIAYYGHDLPDIAKASTFERKRSVTVIASDNETVLARYGELLGKNLTYEDLPKDLINAVIATEDRRFFYHFGIDPIGILRAFMTNVQEKKIAQGGSTITQQLAKNLFLSPERTLRRKIQEAMLAVWLESRYTKEEIIAAYLNRVYMGAGAYGADAAAKIYFNKTAKNLTLHEAATLAGLLKAPSRYNPMANPKSARDRMNVVIRLMDENGMLEEDSDTAASNKDRKNKGVMVKPSVKPYNVIDSDENDRYFTDWIMDLLPDYIGDTQGDLVIYTTLDPSLQEKAAEAAKRYTEEYATWKKRDAPEFSLILVDKSGAVRAMLGGADYNKSQFNRATQAMRQPGSSFKPFVYLSALQQGWGIHSLISDEPFSKNGYRPTNYTGDFHGEVPLWVALSQSYNVATVRLLDLTGVDGTIRTAHKLGISTSIQPDLSIALGTSETTLLEMVGAYQTLARQGRPTPPFGINRIITADNKTLFDIAAQREARAKATEPVIDPATIGQLTLMLEDVVSQGTGRRAILGFPVAGKTGTSQENRDAWFLGYSSDYTAGVWVGYDDNQPMKDVYGGTLPASIWADTMRYAHRQRGGAPLTRSEDRDGSAFSRLLGRLIGSDDGDAYSPQGANAQRLNSLKRPASVSEGHDARRPIGNNPNRF